MRAVDSLWLPTKVGDGEAENIAPNINIIFFRT